MAARRIGGPRKLRDYLRAPSAGVISWLAGVEEPPTSAFLRALELILNDLDSRTVQPKTEKER